ncbi:cytochrome P450 family protein [Rhizoctonia solani AG-3 Rhs1AP]|uniref:Cytochrome P450 family protein n=1 Tax=Rhizoctonia solani AG-3 Rhs1AP TaxID=1086054 RepID=X8J6H9_9AGAM|nr:cytochrome P450 family protein [Rhizoctonia solani AG-3 Rhs1AP]
MSNLAITSLASLRSLLNGALQSESGTLGPHVLETAKQHSNQLVLALLGLLTARSIYPILKRSTTFRELDGPKPESVLWGDEALLFRPETSLTTHEELLKTYGSVCKIKGMFGEDRLWIADPRAMNDIILKAYDSFHEPEPFLIWMRLATGNHLLTTHGHKHKMQRKILNPVFTASHMRKHSNFHCHCPSASKAQASYSASGGMSGVVDIYPWMGNVALEMIGQAGMGYSFGALEGEEHAYLKASQQLFPSMNALWFVRPFLTTLVNLGSSVFRRAVVDRLPFKRVQDMKSVADIMDSTAVHIYQKKKAALASGTLESEIAAGQDIISMLLKQNEVVSPEEQMNEEEIIAHVNALVFAGNDTTSAALAQTFYLLAKHLDVQDRIREEVQEAHRLYGRDLDYDQLNSLTFLDAVCRESLRLWAPAQMVERIACVDYNLPLHYPVKSKDGKTMISNIHVPKGTHIYLSLSSTNRDKQTWGEDADKFNPYRWLEPMPSSVSESRIPGVYSNMMTFLGGPRACLGFKFSQLEMKIVLSLLISRFRFNLGSEDIGWVAGGVVRPHVRGKDGVIDFARGPTLPMKVTVLE